MPYFIPASTLFGTLAATLYFESTSSVMSYFNVEAKRIATSLSVNLYFCLIHVANWEVATWIDSGTEGLRTRRRITQGARTWDDAGRESAALWRGS